METIDYNGITLHRRPLRCSFGQSSKTAHFTASSRGWGHQIVQNIVKPCIQ